MISLFTQTFFGKSTPISPPTQPSNSAGINKASSSSPSSQNQDPPAKQEKPKGAWGWVKSILGIVPSTIKFAWNFIPTIWNHIFFVSKTEVMANDEVEKEAVGRAENFRKEALCLYDETFLSRKSENPFLPKGQNSNNPKAGQIADQDSSYVDATMATLYGVHQKGEDNLRNANTRYRQAEEKIRVLAEEREKVASDTADIKMTTSGIESAAKVIAGVAALVNTVSSVMIAGNFAGIIAGTVGTIIKFLAGKKVCEGIAGLMNMKASLVETQNNAAMESLNTRINLLMQELQRVAGDVSRLQGIQSMLVNMMIQFMQTTYESRKAVTLSIR